MCRGTSEIWKIYFYVHCTLYRKVDEFNKETLKKMYDAKK